MSFVSKLPHVGPSIFATMSRLAEQEGALNLGQGFADFEPPERLRRSLARFVEEGRNQYAPLAGISHLRERIAAKLDRDYGCAIDAENHVTVTSGATEGIFDVIAATVSPGDEVIVLDPSYDSYEPSVRLQGGRCVRVPLTLGFGIDFERLASALSERTRLLVLNFPHNPSGAVLTARDLDDLWEVVRKTRVLVLSDEVYEHIVFDGVAHQSLLRHPELRERSFVVSSFGKLYHNTGWKVGWVAANAELTRELRNVHQFVTFSTNTPAQWALADVLAEQPEYIYGIADFYQAKRDQFRRMLEATPLELLPVAGTFFQLIDYAAVSNEDDVAFAQRLTRQAKVAAIPVSVFEASPQTRRLVRLCFARSAETLKLACERLDEFCRSQ